MPRGPILSRYELLESVGLRAFEKAGANTPNSKRLVSALAAMLDATLPKPKGKRSGSPTPSSLPFGPKQIFDALERHCVDIIQLRPYDGASFGRLGRQMLKIEGLVKEDLDLVVGWIQSGGLSSWPTTPTWNHVCKHFTNWVATARATQGKAQTIPGAGPLVFR